MSGMDLNGHLLQPLQPEGFIQYKSDTSERGNSSRTYSYSSLTGYICDIDNSFSTVMDIAPAL